ncbi:MAG: serine hydrolase domain-containing protein [Taibaiella sp.]|jgi:CubicO group peptidase (beta-lactamase class C family)
MTRSFFKIPFVLFTFLSFVACQTVSEQNAQASPPLAPPDNTFSTVKLDFTDTSSPEGRVLIHKLDSFYGKQVNAGFNGSVLVGYKGKIMYERYFGYCNKATDTKLCAQNPSQLASTSKPFTATAVLWLHQNKYLNIDQPVQKYLKDFPYLEITVAMLLSQRSGLPDYTKMGNRYWKSDEPMYNEDLLQILARNKPRLNSRPNTRFEYSNTNYAMLARVIEEVSKMPYKQFMKEFIFDPLGMKNTFVYDPADRAKIDDKVAQSYQYNWSVYKETNEDGVYGDKGIYSTVEDMYRWDQSFYKNVLLNEKTLRMAYTGYSNERAGTKNYGFGWRMLNFNDGYKIIYHNGWWHGNNTVFYRFIKDNFTIIVLGNKYNSKIYGHAKSIYGIVKNSSEHDDMEWEESGSPKEE